MSPPISGITTYRPATRAAQARLARAYGIDAFCYYHFWFGGKRLLERPLAEVLASGEPDFPFCVCWANENWTRRWDGLDQEVLMAQRYSREDCLAFIEDLYPLFRDRRYVRWMEGRCFSSTRSPRFPTLPRWWRYARCCALRAASGSCTLRGPTPRAR
jgi:lipopolysaccharide biosynthesis protein